jgi:hypothetical protein
MMTGVEAIVEVQEGFLTALAVGMSSHITS